MAKLTIGLSSNAPEQLNAVSDSDFPCQVTVTNLAGLVVFSSNVYLTEKGSNRTIPIADKNAFSRLVNDLHGIGRIHKKDVLACVEWQSSMDLEPETPPADSEQTEEAILSELNPTATEEAIADGAVALQDALVKIKNGGTETSVKSKRGK